MQFFPYIVPVNDGRKINFSAIKFHQMKIIVLGFLITLFCGFLNNRAVAQRETNYEEAKVPEFKLPPILIDEAGNAITSKVQWTESRRGEILSLFETFVYGKTPQDPVQVEFKLHKINENAMGGKAIKKEIMATFGNGTETREMDILIYLAKDTEIGRAH